MISVLLVMSAGIILGAFIHKKSLLIKINDQLISLSIYVLLLLLGISVGLNKTIVQNFGTLGYQALVITLGAVLGSVLFSWIVFRIFFSSETNKKVRDEK
ncbi:MAG: LysO family transporter [Methanococcaceae archaeon]